MISIVDHLPLCFSSVVLPGPYVLQSTFIPSRYSITCFRFLRSLISLAQLKTLVCAVDIEEKIREHNCSTRL